MTARELPSAVATVLMDLRHDWIGWSAAERFTLKLTGAAILALAVILYGPRGFSD